MFTAKGIRRRLRKAGYKLHAAGDWQLRVGDFIYICLDWELREKPLWDSIPLYRFGPQALRFTWEVGFEELAMRERAVERYEKYTWEWKLRL